MRSRAALSVLPLLLGGCLAHKAASKVVDPALLAEGQQLDRDGGPRHGFVLGPYTVERIALDRTPAPNATTGLSRDGQSRPAERIDLTLSMRSTRASWTGRCEALREPTGRADYAAVTDEFHDFVVIDCQFEDDQGGRWVFASKGNLATNLGGTLTPQHDDFVGGRLEVEVLMWRKYWKRIDRHLPHPVAQVRMPRSTVASMVLARPERAWIATDAPPEMLDVSMVTLAALRLLPLGFEG